MNQKRRQKVILAWICFLTSILLFVANLGGFGIRSGVAVPIAMMLLILGILLSASVKQDAA